MIMNDEYQLNTIQFRVSSAVAFDYNQLIYVVCSSPWPRPTPQIYTPSPSRRFLALTRPVKKNLLRSSVVVGVKIDLIFVCF